MGGPLKVSHSTATSPLSPTHSQRLRRGQSLSQHLRLSSSAGIQLSGTQNGNHSCGLTSTYQHNKGQGAHPEQRSSKAGPSLQGGALPPFSPSTVQLWAPRGPCSLHFKSAPGPISLGSANVSTSLLLPWPERQDTPCHGAWIVQ